MYRFQMNILTIFVTLIITQETCSFKFFSLKMIVELSSFKNALLETMTGYYLNEDGSIFINELIQYQNFHKYDIERLYMVCYLSYMSYIGYNFLKYYFFRKNKKRILVNMKTRRQSRAFMIIVSLILIKNVENAL